MIHWESIVLDASQWSDSNTAFALKLQFFLQKERCVLHIHGQNLTAFWMLIFMGWVSKHTNQTAVLVIPADSALESEYVWSFCLIVSVVLCVKDVTVGSWFLVSLSCLHHYCEMSGGQHLWCQVTVFCLIVSFVVCDNNVTVGPCWWFCSHTCLGSL